MDVITYPYPLNHVSKIGTHCIKPSQFVKDQLHLQIYPEWFDRLNIRNKTLK